MTRGKAPRITLRLIPLAGAALTTAALVFMPPRPAEGTYENARAVGKHCVTCHTTLRPNAGTLNETGRFYQLRRTLDGAPGLTPPKPTSMPSKPAPAGAPKIAPPASASSPASSSAAAAPTGTSRTSAPISASAAANTFKQMCAPCHGAQGEGTQMGKAFSGGPLAAQPPAAVAQTIRGGVPNTAMVSFRGVLSPAQIEALARHVLTLAKAH